MFHGAFQKSGATVLIVLHFDGPERYGASSFFETSVPKQVDRHDDRRHAEQRQQRVECRVGKVTQPAPP
jgi:hypothetical protein